MASIIRSNGNLIFQTLDKDASIQFVRGNLDSAENSTIDDWKTSGKAAKLDFANLVNKAASISDDYLTPAPTFSLPSSNLNSGTDFSVTINYPDGFDKTNGYVKVWSDLGQIQNIDKTNGTFVYLAPDVSEDTTDNIYVQLINPGQLESKTISAPITIKKPQMQTDDALVDNDFQANAVNPDVSGLSF